MSAPVKSSNVHKSARDAKADGTNPRWAIFHRAHGALESVGLVGALSLIPAVGIPTAVGSFFDLSESTSSMDLFKATAPLTIAVALAVFLYRKRVLSNASEAFVGCGLILLIGTLLGSWLGSPTTPPGWRQWTDHFPGVLKTIPLMAAYFVYYGPWLFLCSVASGATSGWFMSRKD